MQALLTDLVAEVVLEGATAGERWRVAADVDVAGIVWVWLRETSLVVAVDPAEVTHTWMLWRVWPVLEVEPLAMDGGLWMLAAMTQVQMAAPQVWAAQAGTLGEFRTQLRLLPSPLRPGPMATGSHVPVRFR